MEGTGMNDKKVVGLEFTPVQLADYRLHARRLILEVVADSKFMEGIWSKLLSYPGAFALESFIRFTEAPEDLLLALEVMGMTINGLELGVLRNVSREGIRNVFSATASMACSPGGTVRDACEEMAPPFYCWPHRVKVQYLFLGLLFKEKFGIPYTFRAIETTENNNRINRLASDISGVMRIPDELSIEGVPGIEYLLRVHTLLGLLASIFQSNPSYINTPLTVPCAKGYAVDMLRLLKDLNRTDEDLHDERVAGLSASGWVYGKESDYEKKVSSMLVLYYKLPDLIKTRDRLFRAIVLTLVGLGEYIQS
jgi:hypothetical protein